MRVDIQVVNSGHNRQSPALNKLVKYSDKLASSLYFAKEGDRKRMKFPNGNKKPTHFPLDFISAAIRVESNRSIVQLTNRKSSRSFIYFRIFSPLFFSSLVVFLLLYSSSVIDGRSGRGHKKTVIVSPPIMIINIGL